MTLIASWGGTGSNAYINISQANSFIRSAIIDNTAWIALSTTQKEAALIQATRDIDSKQYIGFRYYYEQRLEFPRQLRSAFPYNRTSTETLTEDIVQVRMRGEVQEACAQQANYIARNGGRNIHAERVQNHIVGWSESVGPMREFIQYGQKATAGGMRITPEANQLLQDWVMGRRIYRA
jgi:hypothetical protein